MKLNSSEATHSRVNVSLLRALYSIDEYSQQDLSFFSHELASLLNTASSNQQPLISLIDFEKHLLALIDQPDNVITLPHKIHAGLYGLIGYLVITADDIEKLLKLLHLTGAKLGFFMPTTLGINKTGSKVMLQINTQFEEWTSLSEVTQQYLVSSWLRIIEIALPQSHLGPILTVFLPTGWVDVFKAEYSDYFKFKATNDQYIHISVANIDREIKLPGGNARLNTIFIKEFEDVRKELDDTPLFSQEVFRYLNAASTLQNSNLTTAASHFAMSERTFSRRLIAEQTSFKQIFVSVRSRRALTLLLEGESIEQIAFILGFSDRSSFERAFKGWQGITPASLQAKYSALAAEKDISDIIDPSQIPALPQVAVKLLNELEQPEVDMEKVTSIVTQDASLSAKVLWVANSSYYGNLNIKSVKHAILSVFGTQRLKALVLNVCATQAFDIDEQQFDIEQYHANSITAAKLTETIYELLEQDQERIADQYFSALLHNLGMIFLYHYLPEGYMQISKEIENESSWAIVNKIQTMRLGINVKDCSSILAVAWDLPDKIKTTLISMASPEKANIHTQILLDIIEFAHAKHRPKSADNATNNNVDALIAKLESATKTVISNKKRTEIKRLVDL